MVQLPIGGAHHPKKSLQDQLVTLILEAHPKEGETAHVEVKDGKLAIKPLIEAEAA